MPQVVHSQLFLSVIIYVPHLAISTSIIVAMFDLLFFVLLTVVVPVLINRTTESHLHWLKPHHLRPIWTVVFAIFSLYLLQKPSALEVVMGLHQKWNGWIGYLVFGLAGALLLTGYWWLTGVTLKPMPTPPQAGVKQAIAPKDDEKPPTLLDLFKKDFPNMMKASDNEDAYTMHSPDGSTLKIKRQTYMDFDAKTKFVGFYIPVPTPPSADLSGQKTFAACMELLRIDAPKQTFDHFEKQVAVLGGYGDQMTTLHDLTFSGRVLIYYEEFLSIPQKADILKAYEANGLAVTFRGTDYLGTKAIAWHQQHDAKKE